MTIEMTNEQDMRDWIADRPMLVLINAAATPHPVVDAVPAELRAAFGDRRVDFLGATTADLDRLGIELTGDERRQFERGEPIVIAITGVAHRQPFKRGRRRKEELECDVQNGLAVCTYAAVERLCEWTRLRDGRRIELTLPERRERVLALLARTPGERSDGRMKRAVAPDDRVAFWRTQYDAGGRLAAGWYADIARPGELASRARRIVFETARRFERTHIDAAIDDEIERLLFLERCLARATELVLTAHEMTEGVASAGQLTKGQQAVLAGNRVGGRPCLYDAVRAAFDGDFDVAALFPSLIVHGGPIKLARLIGRHGRGHAVRINCALIAVLQTAMEHYDECQAAVAANAGALTAAQGAGFWIAKAALELFPRAEWSGAIDPALIGDGAVDLPLLRAG